ncbi:sugar ABC transporter ATP-binding protein [Rhodococcus erythropolis]|uniref:sugar ABC transporter ATP-binding protein n=1 Tax=Rhodococcus erythropolis TaxID=1833 RepID=UPI00294957FB|nr:sugar ABC transporter ATP-binding protein [Rhodococcus erythropolis]MDV6212807.1 sugar ABC transporter ATP-binding protein [Rhodococcus erythropolis]
MDTNVIISDVTKSFAGTRALDSVHLRLERGEVHALLGENGSGKSTLIKILAGFHKPDPGAEIVIAGEELSFGSAEASYLAGCRFVHQDLALVSETSVLDNFFVTGGYPRRLGTISGRRAREEVTRALGQVGLDIDPRRKISGLSPAERTGVAIARALRVEEGEQVRLLVLDEPTATLADDEVQRLLDIVRQVARSGVTVLYVTHHLEEVLQVANRLTVLRDGRVVAEAETEGLSRDGILNLLLGTDACHPWPSVEHDAPGEVKSSSGSVLRVENVSGLRLQPTSFEVQRGEIVGIAGLTGSGRETLLGLISGALRRTAGTVTVSGADVPSFSPRASIRAGMAHLPADRKSSGGVESFSARHNLLLPDLMSFWRWPTMRQRAEALEAAEWFERFDVRPATAQKAMLSTFSGGNQQKILLAKWLRLEPSVILIDQPTQGVDIGAKALIHERLIRAAAAGATIVVASSDAEELEALCQRVLILRGGRIVTQLRGDQITIPAMNRHVLTAMGETA